MNPRPALATGWQWSADYRRLRFDLRSGVKFHSGQPFNSAAAKSNLERLRDPALGSHWLNYARLMHVEAPDSQTLIITYDQPVRSSFDTFALTFIADPQTFGESNGGPSFVGTGPFRFEEWSQGDHLTVVRNPDYWQAGQPYLDGVELHVYSDLAAAETALETGALDWLSGAAAQDARRLASNPAYRVLLNGNGGTFYCVGFDVNVPALADKRVRQGFGYALNRARIVESALNGFGRPASIPWPQQSLAYDATQDQTYTYDLARTKALLQAAAWDSSTVVPLFVPAPVPLTRVVAEILQADLATAGVQVSVQPLSGADFTARGLKGQFAGAFVTAMTFMNLSPATFLTSAIPVRIPNASNFVTDRYTQLIAQSLAATDDQGLKATLHELTGIMLDEAFLVEIAEGEGLLTGPEIVRGTIGGASWDALGLVRYQDVWKDQ
jgi:peptide/nickel transport system substrate-binding protein